MLTDLAARLLTGPLAFLIAGIIDVVLYAGGRAVVAVRKRLSKAARAGAGAARRASRRSTILTRWPLGRGF